VSASLTQGREKEGDTLHDGKRRHYHSGYNLTVQGKGRGEGGEKTVLSSSRRGVWQAFYLRFFVAGVEF